MFQAGENFADFQENSSYEDMIRVRNGSPTISSKLFQQLEHKGLTQRNWDV